MTIRTAGHSFTQTGNQRLIFMHMQCKTIVSLLFVIAGLSIAPAGFSQNPNRTLGVDNPVYSIANDLVMENTRLRAQRLDMERLIETITAEGDAVTRSTRALGERFATARQMVDLASESDALGAILFAYWEGIDEYRHADPTTQLSQRLGDTVISRIDHEEALAEISNPSGYATERIQDSGLDPDTIAQPSRDVLFELARDRRDQLRRIIEAESDYVTALSELEVDYSQLTTAIEEYEEYLVCHGNDLWFRR